MTNFKKKTQNLNWDAKSHSRTITYTRTITLNAILLFTELKWLYKKPRNNLLKETARNRPVDNHKMMLTTNDYGRSHKKINIMTGRKNGVFAFLKLSWSQKLKWNYTVCPLLVAMTQYQHSIEWRLLNAFHMNHMNFSEYWLLFFLTHKHRDMVGAHGYTV